MLSTSGAGCAFRPHRPAHLRTVSPSRGRRGCRRSIVAPGRRVALLLDRAELDCLCLAGCSPKSIRGLMRLVRRRGFAHGRGVYLRALYLNRRPGLKKERAPSSVEPLTSPYRPPQKKAQYGMSHLPPPRRRSPHASNCPTAPRSGGPQPLGRSGELGTMPPDAPVASTPPRRREPGR